MSKKRLTLGSIKPDDKASKYLIFAFYPSKAGSNRVMWNELCNVLFNRKDIGLPIDKSINRNRWLYQNMRHSGVDNSVNYTVHNDGEFSQLMILYHHMSELGYVEPLRIAHNTWVYIS